MWIRKISYLNENHALDSGQPFIVLDDNPLDCINYELWNLLYEEEPFVWELLDYDWNLSIEDSDENQELVFPDFHHKYESYWISEDSAEYVDGSGETHPRMIVLTLPHLMRQLISTKFGN